MTACCLQLSAESCRCRSTHATRPLTPPCKHTPAARPHAPPPLRPAPSPAPSPRTHLTTLLLVARTPSVIQKLLMNCVPGRRCAVRSAGQRVGWQGGWGRGRSARERRTDGEGGCACVQGMAGRVWGFRGGQEGGGGWQGWGRGAELGGQKRETQLRRSPHRTPPSCRLPTLPLPLTAPPTLPCKPGELPPPSLPP